MEYSMNKDDSPWAWVVNLEPASWMSVREEKYERYRIEKKELEKKRKEKKRKE